MLRITSESKSEKVIRCCRKLCNSSFIIYVCFLSSVLYMKLRAMEQVKLMGKMRVFYLVWLKS